MSDSKMTAKQMLQQLRLFQGQPTHVAGFLFSADLCYVMLIRKDSPEWQRGKLNAIGGSIEDGESPLKAQAREFAEETGIVVGGWQELLTLVSIHDTIVRFFIERWNYPYAMPAPRPEPGSAEEPMLVAVADVLTRQTPHPLMGNIPWLVQMALAVLEGHETCSMFYARELATHPRLSGTALHHAGTAAKALEGYVPGGMYDVPPISAQAVDRLRQRILENNRDRYSRPLHKWSMEPEKLARLMHASRQPMPLIHDEIPYQDLRRLRISDEAPLEMRVPFNVTVDVGPGWGEVGGTTADWPTCAQEGGCTAKSCRWAATGLCYPHSVAQLGQLEMDKRYNDTRNERGGWNGLPPPVQGTASTQAKEALMKLHGYVLEERTVDAAGNQIGDSVLSAGGQRVLIVDDPNAAHEVTAEQRAQTVEQWYKDEEKFGLLGPPLDLGAIVAPEARPGEVVAHEEPVFAGGGTIVVGEPTLADAIIAAVPLVRWWISWVEPGLDARPARNWEGAPLWWCTGTGEESVTICALVDAPDEEQAKLWIRQFWNPDDWRFCEERSADYLPSPERFPMGSHAKRTPKPWSYVLHPDDQALAAQRELEAEQQPSAEDVLAKEEQP